jgi:hypothetical protein
MEDENDLQFLLLLLLLSVYNFSRKFAVVRGDGCCIQGMCGRRNGCYRGSRNLLKFFHNKMYNLCRQKLTEALFRKNLKFRKLSGSSNEEKRIECISCICRPS